MLDLRSGASMYYPSWLSRIVARNVVTKPLHRLAIGDLFCDFFWQALPRLDASGPSSTLNHQRSMGGAHSRNTQTERSQRELPVRRPSNAFRPCMRRL